MPWPCGAAQPTANAGGSAVHAAGPWMRFGSWSKPYVLKHGRQLLLQIGNIAIVADDEVRSLRLFVLGQLSGVTRVHSSMTSRGGSLTADVLVGHHRDRVVERGLHARLEQQRHLHHRGPRPRIALGDLLAPAVHPLAHARPEHALEPLALIRILEHDRGDSVAVDAPVRRHALAEALG